MAFYPPRLPQNTPAWFQFVLVAAYFFMMLVAVIGITSLTSHRWKLGVTCLVIVVGIGISLVVAVKQF